MKKILLLLTALCVLFGGCSAHVMPGDQPDTSPPASSPTEDPDLSPNEWILHGMAVEVEEKGLMLAELDQPGSLFHVNTTDARLVGTGADRVNVGDVIDVTLQGEILETYPAQCAAKTIEIIQSYTGNDSAVWGAYYAVFEELYEQDPGLNGDVLYIAVDFSKSKISSAAKSLFLSRLHMLCLAEGLTPLENTYEGLIEEGYVEDMYFKDGILIAFDDDALSDDQLVTQAQKWRSGLGAIGATYTATRDGAHWKLDSKDFWIS